MKDHWRSLTRTLTLLGALCLAAFSRPASAQQLITNGGFETGAFTGWTLANQANPLDVGNQNHFTISTPGADTPPVNGIFFNTAPNPTGGAFYAVSVADLPGAHALLQDFTVTSPSSVLLSFQMFVNDQSGIGPIVDPTGLDYTTGGAFNDNQHARVDLLRAGASDLSTNPADVLANFYLGVDPINFDQNTGNLIPNPYTNYSFDLTSLVGAGGTYRLRFAEVDNLSALNVGVDNVSILAAVAPPSVPEPGSTAALLIGSIGSLALLRRCRRS
jgi:hypothetical protein